MSACPWCRERLPAFNAPAQCPKCAKSLVDPSGGRLRPLDLDYETILKEADETSLVWVKRGAIFAAIAGACASVTFLVPAALVILVLSQFFWGRFLVARRYTKHYSPVRRFATRWITRLTIILFVSPLYASISVPLLGIVTAPLIFTGTNWVLRAYFRFHLDREHRRAGLVFPEILFLVFLSLLFLAVLALFALILAGVLAFTK
jgi:hypothetical protein